MPPKHTKPRIMILGAGLFQLVGIRKAVGAGYHTISVDNIPGNIGHGISSESVICSTVDVDGVLQAARDLQVDGICTFASDVAAPSVGRVCDSLGLTGPSFHAAEIMTQKHRFREFMIEQGLPAPRFLSGSVFNDIQAAPEQLRFPIIFKPADSSGSRGIGKLKTWTEEAAQVAFAKALSFSRSNTVCVEEFLEGTEVGGDAFLMDNELAVVVITNKHKYGFAVRGHQVPCSLSTIDQQRVHEAILVACRALGYFRGPLNFDVMVAPDKTTVIELSPRCGGNGLPSLIHRATGIDTELATLELAIGRDPSLRREAPVTHGCGSLVIGSNATGVIQSMATQKAIQQAAPELFDIHFAKKVGDPVSKFEHGGDVVGCALFDCELPEAYEPISQAIQNAVSLVVAPLSDS